MAISSYSTTPASNTSISGINIAEGCAPSGINNAIRQLMADIALDAVTKDAEQTLTNKTLTSPTISTPSITGFTAHGVLVGGDSNVEATSAGTSGQVLTSNGNSSSPSFQDIPSFDISSVYPVGSLYFNASNSTNPATLLGFGTWVAFGAGRVPIGAGTGTDANGTSQTFAAAATGGEYTHKLTIVEMPRHRHQQQEFLYSGGGASEGGGAASNSHIPMYTDYQGGDGYHNNVQPYITVYIWQRTA